MVLLCFNSPSDSSMQPGLKIKNLEQRFSNFRIHQYHMEVIKVDCWAPHLEFLIRSGMKFENLHFFFFLFFFFLRICISNRLPGDANVLVKGQH